MGDYLDFDALIGARDVAPFVEPVRVQLFGEEWELPGAPPPTAAAKAAELSARGVENVEPIELFSFLVSLVPRHVLDEWERRGLTVAHLSTILPGLLSLYEGSLDKANRELRRARHRQAKKKGGGR